MIGIIPKPVKKAPEWQNIGIYVALGVLVAFVLGYAAIFFFEGKASKSLGNLEERISQVGTKDERNTEVQVLLAGRRIDDFSNLLRQHEKTSNVLKLIEENCHPRVWFTVMDLLTKDNILNISGQTPTFETLGQQILLFQKSSFVKEVNLVSVGVGKRGATEFTLSLLLDPAIFQQ